MKPGTPALWDLSLRTAIKPWAIFLPVQYLPTDEFKEITIGGNFQISDKQLPPIAIIQNGGLDAEGSIIVDNLELFSAWLTPWPAPIEPLETITIPLSLPTNAVPLEMVLIPAGTFMMGSPKDEQDRDSDETQHEVIISTDFYIGKYEVTQAQWESVMRYNPSYYNDNLNNPVEQVSWDDCQAFISNLNKLMGYGTFRLPTEAEWEYACRAGTTTRFYWGDDPDYTEIKDYALYSANNEVDIKTVGQKIPNNWGLFDMSGNVYEWCHDWYGTYTAGLAIDPFGKLSGSYRVKRGSCWDNNSTNFRLTNFRSANRSKSNHSHRNYSIGFRIVLSAKTP